MVARILTRAYHNTRPSATMLLQSIIIVEPTSASWGAIDFTRSSVRLSYARFDAVRRKGASSFVASVLLTTLRSMGTGAGVQQNERFWAAECTAQFRRHEIASRDASSVAPCTAAYIR